MPYAEEKLYRDPDKNKIVQVVFQAKKAAEAAMKPLREKKWRRAYLFYHSQHDTAALARQGNRYPYGPEATLFIPTVLSQVETAVPRLVAGLLGNDPLFLVRAEIHDEDALDANRMRLEGWARRVGGLLDTQLINDVEVRAKAPLWIRDAKIFGTKWLFLEWFSRKGKRYANTLRGGKWKFNEVKGEELLEDRIKITGLPPWDVFPDPLAKNPEDCRFIQRTSILPADMLWQMIQATPKKGWLVKNRKDLEPVEGKIIGRDNWQAVMQTEVGRLDSARGEGWKPKGEDSRMILITDHWEPEWHIMTAGTQSHNLPLLVERNPYKLLRLPFIRLAPMPLDNEIHGLGVDDTITQLAQEINTMTNLRLVNLIRSVNNIIMVNNLSGITANDMVSQPAQIYDVDGTVRLDDCVKMIDWPDVTQDAQREIDYMQQQQQLAGGVTDLSQGQVTPGFTETARGIGYLLEQSASRFTLEVNMLAAQFAQLGRAMHAVNRQFMRRERVVSVLGEAGAREWLAIDPQMMDYNYTIRFDARPEVANKSLQQQQVLNISQILGQWPEFNRQEAILEVVRLSGMPRPERFLIQQSSDAHAENEYFRHRGIMHDVMPGDPHGYHIKVHEILIYDGSMEKWGEEGAQALSEHITQHQRASGQMAPEGQPGLAPEEPGLMAGGAGEQSPRMPVGAENTPGLNPESRPGGPGQLPTPEGATGGNLPPGWR